MRLVRRDPKKGEERAGVEWRPEKWCGEALIRESSYFCPDPETTGGGRCRHPINVVDNHWTTSLV